MLIIFGGKAVGLTDDPKVPFACTDRGRCYSSEFDFNGVGVAVRMPRRPDGSSRA